MKTFSHVSFLKALLLIKANKIDDSFGYIIKITTVEKNLILRASCAIPFVFPFCNINGHLYADGGLKDSIPIKKSISDGNDKNIIVLIIIMSISS